MDTVTIHRLTAAADGFARALCGEDDGRYMDLFLAAVNIAATIENDEADDRGAELLRLVGAGTGRDPIAGGLRTGFVTDANLGRIHDNPSWIENAKLLIADQTRIIGGVPAPDFPDCVAIGSGDRWCCTGTLVAPNVVVTAAHCVVGGCASRVFVGPDVASPTDGEIIEVASTAVHQGYDPPLSRAHDVAVLILANEVTGVSPRSMAPRGALAGATSVLVVGYGTTDTDGSSGYGNRKKVDVPLVSGEVPVGQDLVVEFVAGRPLLERDSCRGDSGGPAYVDLNGSWFLSGVTSRAVPGRRTCGDGGIYSSVAEFEPWIKSVPGGHW
jgi:secreted trypsin-like serine protease